MSILSNYSLSTGDFFITGCRPLIKKKNLNSTVINNSSTISQAIITGNFTSKISINGITLFEEYPMETIINGQSFFSINTGDYYTTFDINGSRVAYFDNFDVTDGDVVISDQKDIDSGVVTYQESTGIGVWENTTIPELTGSIIDSPPTDLVDLFDRWDIFFTGRKVGISESSSLDLLTGKAFIYEKQNDLLSVEFNGYDIYGTGVIPSQSDFYQNGFEKDDDSFLELHTGVTLLRMGIASETSEKETIINNFSL